MPPRVRLAVAGALVFGCSAVVAEPPSPALRVESKPTPKPVVVASSEPAAEPPAPRAVVAEPPAPRAVVAEPDEQPELVAIAREAFVHARPSRRSEKLGYLRLGARLKRDARPTPGDGCPGGWYRVAPDGYVCVGSTATTDLENPLAELARPRPERDDPLPYPYARSKGSPPPLYTRLPGPPERSARRAPGWEDLEDAPIPALLGEGRSLPTVFGFARGSSSDPEHAVANSGFALLSTHEYEGRRFGLTTELELVPLDQVSRVRPSEFHGVSLGGAVSLPVVFVRSRQALLYAGSPERGLAVARPLAHREALAITGKSALVGGRRYLETRAGDWLVDLDLVRIDPPEHPPTWARGGRTWIHVAITAQTLVAYVGTEPVYATLVSTGAGGLGDPEETHATPRGEFLVHTKHVTATMSGDEVGDEFDLGDVPYVQYFSAGYAFHAAYWHDGFGAPRSHGCVNLSPIDARWLFHFTDPPVPRGWHGAFSLRGGTLVSITP